jgi:hypothetical protein
VFAFHRSVISTAVCGCLRFFLGFFGLFDSVARDVEFEDDTVVDQAVNRCCRGHGIFENSFPFGERQIAGDENAATLITFREQREQYFHLFSTLLHVPEIIDDQTFKVRQLFEEATELEVAFGNQEILYQQCRSGEVYASAAGNQLLSNGTEKMRLSAPGIAERQHVVAPVQHLAFNERLR